MYFYHNVFHKHPSDVVEDSISLHNLLDKLSESRVQKMIAHFECKCVGCDKLIDLHDGDDCVLVCVIYPIF